MNKKAQGALAIFVLILILAVIGLVFVLNSEPTITGQLHSNSIVLPRPGETAEEYFQRYEFQRATMLIGRPRPYPYTIYPVTERPYRVTGVTSGSMINNRKFHYQPLLEERARYYDEYYAPIRR